MRSKKRVQQSANQLRSGVGASGSFRFIKHDTKGVPMKPSELVERDASGRIQPRHRELVVQDVAAKNMILRRGLGYIMYQTLRGHPGTTDRVPSEVTVSPFTNPFSHFQVLADAPTYPVDTKVLWGESDGGSNAAIPPGPAPHTAGQGRRGTSIISPSAGPGLRLDQTSYPTTSPYRELEYILFAQSNTAIGAVGSITTDGVGNLPSDGDYFEIDDGINTLRRFEFDNGGAVAAGSIPVDVTGSPTADIMRDRIIAAVNGAGTNSAEEDLLIFAEDGGSGTVTLTQTGGGTVGNNAITETVGSLGAWAFTGMVSGSGGLEVDDTHIDNLPIKSIGLAAAADSGQGEANSYWGLRAVVGLLPTIQGKSDRAYAHEKEPGVAKLKHYTSPTDTISVDGFVGSTAQSDAQIDSDLTGTASDTIVVSTRKITVANAVTNLSSTKGFSSEHIRKTLRISNSSTGGNNQDYTIEKVISPVEVQVLEPPIADVTEDFLATGDGVYTQYTGDRAFDGEIAGEGDSSSDFFGTVYQGDSFVGAPTGPYVLGRVWLTQKTIKGIRVVGPAGTNKTYYPSLFKIQYLDPTANTGSPRPAFDTPPGVGDWIDVPGHDYSGTSQSTAIFDNGELGVEYLFASTVVTKGIRIVGLEPDGGSTLKVEVAELYCFEEMDSGGSGVELSGDALVLSVDGNSTKRTVDLVDTAATQNVSQLVDAISPGLRGYGMEAVRSNFGYLWVRATVAGDNSTIDLDSVNNGSSANVKLGLAGTVGTTVSETGVTQKIQKLPRETLTVIYRVSLSGDLPQ